MFEEDREEMNELRKQEFERRNAGSKGSVQTYTLTYPTSFWPIGQHSDLPHHSLTYPYYIIYLHHYILTYSTTLCPVPLHSDLSHSILTYIHYILTYLITFWPICNTSWPIPLHFDLFDNTLTYPTTFWSVPLFSDLSHWILTYPHFILIYQGLYKGNARHLWNLISALKFAAPSQPNVYDYTDSLCVCVCVCVWGGEGEFFLKKLFIQYE